jgi:hypothetical protein
MAETFYEQLRPWVIPQEKKLRLWCKESVLDWHNKSVSDIKVTQELKKEAVIELCTRTGVVKNASEKYDIVRETLNNLKNDLLPGGANITVDNKKDKPLPNNFVFSWSIGTSQMRN